jgi:hypothetical protein
MKLDPHNITVPVEHVIQAEQKKTKLLDQKKFIPGLKVWKFKIETGEVTNVPMESVEPVMQSINHKQHVSLHAKVQMEEGYLYLQALNEDSAARKFYRLIGVNIPTISQLRKSKQQK